MAAAIISDETLPCNLFLRIQKSKRIETAAPLTLSTVGI
jgi:hypothetical protein